MSEDSTSLPKPPLPLLEGSRLKKVLFWLVVGLQFAALAWMIVDRKHLLDRGHTVLLKCRPIDPRSLFSGDYVVLSYEISRLTGNQMSKLYAGEEPIKRGESIYVFLRQAPGDEFHSPVGVSKEIDGYPEVSDDAITVMQGTAGNFYAPTQNADHLSPLVVRYGIENYFVPQGEGKIIENSLNKASVEVAVRATSGESAIRKLFLGGQEVVFH